MATSTQTGATNILNLQQPVSAIPRSFQPSSTKVKRYSLDHFISGTAPTSKRSSYELPKRSSYPSLSRRPSSIDQEPLMASLDELTKVSSQTSEDPPPPNKSSIDLPKLDELNDPQKPTDRTPSPPPSTSTIPTELTLASSAAKPSMMKSMLPQVVVRVERDYSLGDGVTKFSSEFPIELEGRVPAATFVATIEGLNRLFRKAEGLGVACLDNVIEVLTIYTWTICCSTYYQRSVKRVMRFVEEENQKTYNALGVNFRNPTSAAFLFLEIEVF